MGLKVRAIVDGDVRWAGYYDLKRRKPGDVFELANEKEFSSAWMEPIGWTPKPTEAGKIAAMKEVIKTGVGAMGSRQSAMDKAKAGKAMSLAQMGGVSAADPVPVAVVEVNTEDRSPNAPEEAI